MGKMRKMSFSSFARRGVCGRFSWGSIVTLEVAKCWKVETVIIRRASLRFGSSGSQTEAVDDICFFREGRGVGWDGRR